MPTATKALSSSQKIIVVLIRYFIHATASVVYRIRNGGGICYLVTLNANGTTSCVQADGEPCPSAKHHGRSCYHVKECQRREEERTRKQQIEAEIARIDAETQSYIVDEVARVSSVQKSEDESSSANQQDISEYYEIFGLSGKEERDTLTFEQFAEEFGYGNCGGIYK
jgi:hypothetical protein